jgi:hypothetical protein
MVVPDSVRDAIDSFEPPHGATITKPMGAHQSLIYKWGVRVAYEAEGKRIDAWFCLASPSCRAELKRITLYGKTSKATLHLKDAHGVSSRLQERRSSNRKDEADRLRESSLFYRDPRRLLLLQETVRIALNNLPHELVGHPSSQVIHQLFVPMTGEDPPMSYLDFAHATAELHASASSKVAGFLRDSRFAVTSWLSCAADVRKYSSARTTVVGLRVYCIGPDWKPKSYFLGSRHIVHPFGEEDVDISQHYYRWVSTILRDFEIDEADVFSSSIDYGMMESEIRFGFGLRCERCLVRLASAAVKSAFGIVAVASKSSNPAMTDLIGAIVATAYSVHEFDGMESLVESLKTFLSTGRSKQRLTPLHSIPFIALIGLLESVLENWSTLVQAFAINRCHEMDQGMQNLLFPLEGKQIDIIHILCLLHPVKTMVLATQDDNSTQPGVILVPLCRLRMTTLDISKHLRDYREPNRQFEVDQLSPLVTRTRTLLRDAFHQAFFARYTEPEKIQSSPYLFEMQLMLDPVFKNPSRVLGTLAAYCNKQLGHSESVAKSRADLVIKTVQNRMLTVMKHVAQRSGMPPVTIAAATAPESFPELDEICESSTNSDATTSAAWSDVLGELHRWLDDPVMLVGENPRAPPVLRYWSEQAQGTKYAYLPQVARVVFSAPVSFVALDEDMLSAAEGSARTSQMPLITDMSSFLNINRDHIDILQCPELTERQREGATPDHLHVRFRSVYQVVDQKRLEKMMASLDDDDESTALNSVTQEEVDVEDVEMQAF